MSGLLRSKPAKDRSFTEIRYVTESNFMNSKINNRSKVVPENLKLNGTTPSGLPRLFVCNVCTKAFSRQEHLKRHERSHTNERPYECGLCDKNFTRRDLLLRHTLKFHNGEMDENFLKVRCASRSRKKNVSTRSRKHKYIGSNSKSENRRISNTSTQRDNCAFITRYRRHSTDALFGIPASNNKSNINNNSDYYERNGPIGGQRTNSVFTVNNTITTLSSLLSSKSSISPRSHNYVSSFTPTSLTTISDLNNNNNSTTMEFEKSKNCENKFRKKNLFYLDRSPSNNVQLNVNDNLESFYLLPRKSTSFSPHSVENYALPLYYSKESPNLDKTQFLTTKDLGIIFDLGDIDNIIHYDSANCQNVSNFSFIGNASGGSESNLSEQYSFELDQESEFIPVDFNLDDLESLSIEHFDLDDIMDDNLNCCLQGNGTECCSLFPNNVSSMLLKPLEFGNLSVTETFVSMGQGLDCSDIQKSTFESLFANTVSHKSACIPPSCRNQVNGCPNEALDLHVDNKSSANKKMSGLQFSTSAKIEIPSLFNHIQNYYHPKMSDNATSNRNIGSGIMDNNNNKNKKKDTLKVKLFNDR